MKSDGRVRWWKEMGRDERLIESMGELMKGQRSKGKDVRL